MAKPQTVWNFVSVPVLIVSIILGVVFLKWHEDATKDDVSTNTGSKWYAPALSLLIIGSVGLVLSALIQVVFFNKN